MNADLGALGPIAARKAAEVEALRCAGAALWSKAESMPAACDVGVLAGGRVIAEMKRRSPSAGTLRPDLDAAAMARSYAAAGAAAVSVLTDGPGFAGSLDDLQAARHAIDVALLRKDFVVDPLQVAEARVAGADWVLLIVALLDADRLDACLDAARRAHAYAIVEVHDEAETRRAVVSGAACIGVNNRDLRTMRVDLATFARLRRGIPGDVVTVAESGVREPRDARRLVEAGADAVLVGEALMRAPDAAAACAAMVAAARAGAGSVA